MAAFRIGVLISGSGSNLQAIIDACATGKIDGRVAFVGSDVPGAKGLERADRHKVPTFVVDYTKIDRRYKAGREDLFVPEDVDWDDLLKKQRLLSNVNRAGIIERLIPRLAAENRLFEHISRYGIDLLVLAGFMRKLTPYFIDRINGDAHLPRIMNIHPSILPAFPGVDGYGDTFRYGCKVGGCTVHFVDYGEDTGPIVGQRTFQIRADDTLAAVKQRGLRLEWALYPHCIQLYAQDRLRLKKRSCRRADGSSYTRMIVEVG